VMGIFWKRTSRQAVVLGMLLGLGVTISYIVWNAPAVRSSLGLEPLGGLIGGIQPISAGVLGVPIGFLTIWLASWVWPQLESTDATSASHTENPFPGL
ncbi:MAG: Cation/acetate symporter ActP, partial [Pseudomonadota bacterium]